MPHFGVLETEESVQLGDKTRLDGYKSFTTSNQTSFTKLSIRPAADEPNLDAYDSVVINRSIDWVYSDWSVDIDSSNNKIDFVRSGVTYAATLTTGTYTLSTLATEIAARMNAVDANGYAASFDVDDKLTISGTAAFLIKPKTGANKLTSFLADVPYALLDSEMVDATSFVSERVEYLKRKVVLSVGEDVKQVQTVTCIADVASALGGKYFYLYSAEDAVKYAVWIDVDNLSTAPVLSGVTLIEVNITAGASATAVATAVASAIDAEADFVATSNLAVVTVTNAAFGYATPATEFNSGFTLALTTEGQQLATDSAYVKVYSKLGDGLFSSDDDLRKYEPDILKWCPKWRSSFLDIHRQAQREILDYLDRNGYVDVYRKKFTKWAIKDVTEVNQWSMFIALRIIFGGINNSKDDVFIKKSDSYLEKEITARQRAILRLDVDGTGTVEDDEGIDPYSIKLGFR